MVGTGGGKEGTFPLLEASERVGVGFSFPKLALKGDLPLHPQKPYLQSNILAFAESLSFSKATLIPSF